MQALYHSLTSLTPCGGPLATPCLLSKLPVEPVPFPAVVRPILTVSAPCLWSWEGLLYASQRQAFAAIARDQRAFAFLTLEGRECPLSLVQGSYYQMSLPLIPTPVQPSVPSGPVFS